jgi:hypothetical protein
MKLKYNFVVQNVSGKPVAVAVGQDNEKFNGMIKLNASGEVIFKMLSEADYTEEEILSRFAVQFGVTEDTAKLSVLAFIDQLRRNGLLVE